MSRRPPETGPPAGGDESARLSREELEKLIEEAEDRPEEVSALVKKLVLETIEDVRRKLSEGSS